MSEKGEFSQCSLSRSRANLIFFVVGPAARAINLGAREAVGRCYVCGTSPVQQPPCFESASPLRLALHSDGVTTISSLVSKPTRDSVLLPQRERERKGRGLQFSWYARSPNTLAAYACLRTTNASRSGSVSMLGTIIVPSRMRKHCACMHRMTTSVGGRPLHRNRHVSCSLFAPSLPLLSLSFSLCLHSVMVVCLPPFASYSGMR